MPTFAAPFDRAARLRWIGVGAYVVGFVGWLLLARGMPGFRPATNLVSMIGPLAMIVACAPLVWRSPAGRARRSAAALLGAAVGFSGSQACWSYYSFVGDASPFPSIADAFSLCAYATLLAGLLMLPWRAVPAAVRGRAMLDAATSTVGVAAFTWHFVFAPTLAASVPDGASTLGRAIALAYPLLDLTALFLNLLLLGTARRRGVSVPAAFALIAPGPIVAVAGILFFVQTTRGTYQPGGLIDATWPTAVMLLAVAGWHLCRDAAATEVAVEDDASRPSTLTVLLPYALVVPVVGLAIYASRTAFWSVDAVGARMAAVAVVGLLLVRQLLVIAENERLYGRLKRVFAEVESSHHLLAVANEQLAQANEQLRSLATTDAMTRLANHRALQARLRDEIARSRRSGQPFGLILIDVDHFKQLNDTFGHPAGDEVLRAIADLLRASVRSADLAARYGGEEFAVVCPQATAVGVAELAERIRLAVAGHAFALPDGGPLRRAVTVSIGTSGTGLAGLDAERLIRTADAAMYQSKAAGRDRVTAAGEPDAISAAA